MLKSISAWAFKDLSSRTADSVLAAAAEHGFPALELTIDGKGFLTVESDQAACKKILQAAKKCGVKISSVASGLGWQFPLSSADQAKAIEVLQKSARIAGWLGVDCLLVVPGVVSGLGAKGKEHVPYDVAYTRMQAGILQAIAAAAEARVKLGVENVWNKVLLSPLEMRDFVDSFRSEWVVTYLDVGNMIITGFAEDWVRILGKRTGCVHFKDFKRDVGTLAGFCDLLDGDVNYPEVMKALREVGYDGPCVAEFFGLESKALQKVSDAMDKILAM